MKILFDHQLFSWQRWGGASKYFAMLLNNMPKENWDTTTIFSNNEYVKALNLFSCRHLFSNKVFSGQGLLMHTLNKPYSLYRLRKRDYDVYHQTHFDPFGLRAIKNKPMVTTFHDINCSTLNPDMKMVKWQEQSLNRANKVVAVSCNTKQDLVNTFNIAPEKVEVIYHGIETDNLSYAPRIFDFPYILYVGTRDHHKNFERFAKAYSVFQKKFQNIRLVCTWKDFTPSEKELIHRLNISDRVIHYSANEAEMNTLYKNALFFAFPSLYEGFGMPILEAMINKCPVVLSNASCFPEIAQNAGLYFNPNEIDDMVAVMSRVAESENLRTELVSLGLKRVADFSWGKCAQEHMRVYESII